VISRRGQTSRVIAQPPQPPVGRGNPAAPPQRPTAHKQKDHDEKKH
jgi:hypothetical protein